MEKKVINKVIVAVKINNKKCSLVSMLIEKCVL